VPNAWRVRDDLVNFALHLTLLFIALAQSWNILGGYAGPGEPAATRRFVGAGALSRRWALGPPDGHNQPSVHAGGRPPWPSLF
jgi:hypothetical protein